MKITIDDYRVANKDVEFKFDIRRGSGGRIGLLQITGKGLVWDATGEDTEIPWELLTKLAKWLEEQG